MKEKTALVTGGNSGIGLASAKLFANEGAYVFITGQREPELAAVVAEIGINATDIQGDVSKLDDLPLRISPSQERQARCSIRNAGFLKEHHSVRLKRRTMTPSLTPT